MDGKRFTLFRLFGFTVDVDLSWIFIALLVTWSLAVGFFPSRLQGFSPGVYWVMGVVGAVGLFASIIFHELCHSLVARRYGLPMAGITLFLFGGVSEMSEEPADPRTEFLMAVAGPVSSIVLGALLWMIYRWGEGSVWPPAVAGVIGYLAFINLLLAAFNLLPAFPLDGGRMLRSALWKWKGDLTWATRTAAAFGSSFAFGLIALGVIVIFAGNLVGGMWYVIIGLFLRQAAQMAYQQVLVRERLGHERVRDRMTREPVTAPPGISLRELVEDYVYKYHFKLYPVVEEGRLLGCVSTRDIKGVPREEWETRTVRSVAGECAPNAVVTPDTEVSEALTIMNSTGRSRLLVVDDGRLVGIIALKDILKTLSLQLDLEGR